MMRNMNLMAGRDAFGVGSWMDETIPSRANNNVDENVNESVRIR